MTPIGENDALIVVDMQMDFVDPSGALHVGGGPDIVAGINKASSHCPFRLQVATQDWHPEKHMSFLAEGGLWPPHCVRGTPGSEFHRELRTERYHLILRKGTRPEADSYSAFMDDGGVDTGLAGLLRSLGITRVVLCGLAYDYCVYFTALDALAAGLMVVVVEDLCRAVNVELLQERRRELQSRGAQLVTLGAIMH